MLIARLIAEHAKLSEISVEVVRGLDLQGMSAAAQMLEGGLCQIRVSSSVSDKWLPAIIAKELRHLIEQEHARVDALITDHEPQVPQLFVSDMDSTMIQAECIDELADFAGLKDHVAAITERTMQGELDFESALRERVRLLAGLPEGAIAECLASRIAPMPGARVLVETLKAKGCRTVLVTGGFHHFADPVAEQLGFERVVANRLEVAQGKLTGRLTGPITDSAVKRAVLLEEAARLGEGTITLATGDGANDIPMIEAATYGIAFAAKPKARAAADGWIDRGDLTGVLELLAVPQAEWITARQAA